MMNYGVKHSLLLLWSKFRAVVGVHDPLYELLPLDWTLVNRFLINQKQNDKFLTCHRGGGLLKSKMVKKRFFLNNSFD